MEKLNFNNEPRESISPQVAKDLENSLELILKNKESEKEIFPEEYYNEIEDILSTQALKNYRRPKE